MKDNIIFSRYTFLLVSIIHVVVRVVIWRKKSGLRGKWWVIAWEKNQSTFQNSTFTTLTPYSILCTYENGLSWSFRNHQYYARKILGIVSHTHNIDFHIDTYRTEFLVVMFRSLKKASDTLWFSLSNSL